MDTSELDNLRIRCRNAEEKVAELTTSEVESNHIRAILSDILTRTANALKGEPPELSSHSWHDLPERALSAVANEKAMAEELKLREDRIATLETELTRARSDSDYHRALWVAASRRANLAETRNGLSGGIGRCRCDWRKE